jgi:hypothetical protein
MLEEISVCTGQFLFMLVKSARYAPSVSLNFAELLTAVTCSQRSLRSQWSARALNMSDDVFGFSLLRTSFFMGHRDSLNYRADLH